MRLGVAGLMPGKISAITENAVRGVAELGFSGATIHLLDDPFKLTKEEISRARALMEGYGIRLVQFWGFYPSIITPDPKIRAEAIDILRRVFELAGWFGAESVGVRPTSMNPRGVWWPHPDNYLPETEDRLVESLKQIADFSAQVKIPLALECHTTTTLKSPAIVRRIIDKVGSPWVKFNLDAVNFVRDIDTAYNTAALVDEIFEYLGPFVVSAHIKDVYVEDRHTVHISETIPGEGIFDLDRLFTRFEQLLPNSYALIEHLPENLIPQAYRNVRDMLQKLAIPIVS